MVKDLPAVQETHVRSLGWEDPMEEEMATHSSVLAWEIPWTRRPARYSPWGRKEWDTADHERLTLMKGLGPRDVCASLPSAGPLPQPTPLDSHGALSH